MLSLVLLGLISMGKPAARWVRTYVLGWVGGTRRGDRETNTRNPFTGAERHLEQRVLCPGLLGRLSCAEHGRLDGTSCCCLSLAIFRPLLTPVFQKHYTGRPLVCLHHRMPAVALHTMERDGDWPPFPSPGRGPPGRGVHPTGRGAVPGQLRDDKHCDSNGRDVWPCPFFCLGSICVRSLLGAFSRRVVDRA